MLDFTSALYLGLRHPTWSLRPWHQFTTGVPAVLRSSERQPEIARALAALQGCEQATLGPSTLHLFWDLFGLLSPKKEAVYVDAGVYPIARWGAERAAGRGVRVRRFPHHDVGALRERLARDRFLGLTPVIVADGFCPACGQPAPVASYLESARQSGGYLVLDDTQALGILGHSRSEDTPYGRGGGGSLRWHAVGGSDVLVVSSLAKAFGVPMAMLAGSRSMVEWFQDRSETQRHCSPVSVAGLHAAEHALTVNSRLGDSLRRRLAQLLHFFRSRLVHIGWHATGRLFPVQTLLPTRCLPAEALHEHLLRRGIQAVLQHGPKRGVARISFLLTARHTDQEINSVIDALDQATGLHTNNAEALYGTPI